MQNDFEFSMRPNRMWCRYFCFQFDMIIFTYALVVYCDRLVLCEVNVIVVPISAARLAYRWTGVFVFLYVLWYFHVIFYVHCPHDRSDCIYCYLTSLWLTDQFLSKAQVCHPQHRPNHVRNCGSIVVMVCSSQPNTYSLFYNDYIRYWLRAIKMQK
jgi:hypothetical protein